MEENQPNQVITKKEKDYTLLYLLSKIKRRHLIVELVSIFNLFFYPFAKVILLVIIIALVNTNPYYIAVASTHPIIHYLIVAVVIIITIGILFNILGLDKIR